ncbi:MAG TPA: glycoside hydrolase family 16 protein [Caulobacterales bacterium]|nr:glycoside hydrolase family 16 protein [Caulobacterales bacterium]
MSRWRVATLLVLALSVACCGGGGGGGGASAPPPPPPPAGPGAAAINEAGGLPSGYTLVWSDEFTVDGLPDAAKWDYDTDRNALGWYNNEAQYYSRARSENSRVDNGVLTIEARREDLDPTVFADWGGQHYTSARLVTRGKAAWTYGFVEVRAKLPCGTGTWPAIWMLSAPPQSTWPDDGEIDIMEHVGYDPGVIHGTVHTKAYNSTINTARSAAVTQADVCAAFHRYQMTWTANRITIGMDDVNYFQYSNDHSGNSEWPFDSPQYLLLNIAVGGTWGGAQGIDATIFPVRMEVDYVRVYQAN